MEHRFGQRIRRRELPELRLEVDRSPTPVDRRGTRRSPGAGVIVRPTELSLRVGSPPLEDAYSARQATRILHMSGRLELEALQDEPDDRKEGLALQAWGATAGHPLR